MVFLRDAQIAALDDSLRQLAPSDVTTTVMDVTVVDGVPQFSEQSARTPTQFFVAVYAPDGSFLASGGGNGTPPEFPATIPLQQTLEQGTEPFVLTDDAGIRTYHASIDVLTIEGVLQNYTQLVALPLSPVNQTVGSYIGIYTVLALLTMVLGALITRWLVTLTFRSLGQVEETAMSIAAGDFGQRMGDVAPGTEVGKLKTAINAMLDRVDRAIAQRDATVLRMRRFIGDASHELRTPLVTVRGYAELYRIGAITQEEDVRQAMERIEKEATRMGVLVEDLLALARLDERRNVDSVPVDLAAVARDAAMDAHAASPDRTVRFVQESPIAAILQVEGDAPPQAAPRRRGVGRLRRRGRTLEPDVTETGTVTLPDLVPAPPEPIVLGDEDRIRQVVANLLGNARRYTPEGSPIELSVGVDSTAGMGWISIIDHGDGVPPQIKEKIFERFWRADTSRTRETGGSGLGLSIVASIVESLHGAIDVLDTPGGGATFRASFPLARTRRAEEHLLIETQPLPRINLPPSTPPPQRDA